MRLLYSVEPNEKWPVLLWLKVNVLTDSVTIQSDIALGCKEYHSDIFIESKILIVPIGYYQHCEVSDTIKGTWISNTTLRFLGMVGLVGY